MTEPQTLMTKIATTAALLAATALGLATPAQASEDSYLAALDRGNIKYHDEDTAIETGRWVCDNVGRGSGDNVAGALIRDGMDPLIAYPVVAAAMAHLCFGRG